MRRFDMGLKLWYLMVAVAVMGVALASTRAESAPSAAIGIIGFSVAALGSRFYSQALSGRQASGLATSGRQKVGLLLSAGGLAVAVIGLADIAFLTGYYGFMRVVYAIQVSTTFLPWSPYTDPAYMIPGAIIGAIVALGVASFLMRTVGSERRRGSEVARGWRRLWPVGVVVLIGALLGAEPLYERYEYCQKMAERHAKRQGMADRFKAAKHAWYKRWYQRAAIRPWLPIHPDHAP